ncbi:Hypothetical predicted protein [Podarcis lilfordi]|uniref:Uncharacterized protein n=1 Tax=Podarcis lilfordi TaxID=74358 RepID=A0AA35KV61_9SAUR|nr:Hypothetical predicted protein [Podarcis lilfordi]
MRSFTFHLHDRCLHPRRKPRPPQLPSCECTLHGYISRCLGPFQPLAKCTNGRRTSTTRISTTGRVQKLEESTPLVEDQLRSTELQKIGQRLQHFVP